MPDLKIRLDFTANKFKGLCFYYVTATYTNLITFRIIVIITVSGILPYYLCKDFRDFLS